VCSVVRRWTQTRSGTRRFSMTRQCSRRSQCKPGWTGWPYTDTYVDSSSSSDDSDSDSSYDYEDDTLFFYDYRYTDDTTHTSCEAVVCGEPSGTVFLSLIAETIVQQNRPIKPSVKLNGDTSLIWELLNFCRANSNRQLGCRTLAAVVLCKIVTARMQSLHV